MGLFLGSPQNGVQVSVAIPKSTELVRPQDVRRAASVAKVKDVFSTVGYRLEAVRDGQVRVPRIEHAYLPHDMQTITQAVERKQIFLQFMLPYVLEANQKIIKTRTRLESVAAKLEEGMPVSGKDVEWLAALGEEYNVQPDNIDALLRRIDVVPPSLALAQAAVESGWGTSRFAQEGNAPFGQWTTAAYSGLVPLKREEGKDHKIRAFKKIGDSVASYLKNLNTHRAYRGFREQRASLREEEQSLNSLKLAAALSKYSEKGVAYVDLLRSVIRVNKLQALDKAKLGDTIVFFKPGA